MILGKKYSTLVFFFFLFLVQGFSQEFKSDEDRRKQAEKLFQNGKYIEAAPHFLHFLSLDQENHEFNYKYGACLTYFGKDKTEPLKYLQYAIKDKNIDPFAYYFLGKAYQQSFRFSSAIIAFETYKLYATYSQMEQYQISNEIRACNNGKELLKNFSEIIVISKKNVKSGKFQYSYDLENIGGKLLNTDQFQTKLDKKKDHKAIVYFPKNNNQYIIYSSYGSDGSTGKDLYRVKRLANGEFSDPVKLSDKINTPYDEDFAFLHSDGKTFYFSSKGHNSMGGYDIFKSEYDSKTNTFTNPVNLDFKINTPADDLLYIVDESGKYAYFSSNRASQGGRLDVYHIRNQTIPYSNVYIVGSFINEINDNLSVSIKVEDASNKSVVGIYNSKVESGAYMVKIPKSGAYNYYVELEGDTRVYKGSISIPSSSAMMLKQEMLLEKIGGKEELIIKNLFDEEIPNSEDLLANMFIEISNLKENSEGFDESMLDGDFSKELMAQFGIDISTATEQELLNVVNQIVDKSKKSTNTKKQLIENAYEVADQKNKDAILYKDQADELTKMYEVETDETNKATLLNQIKEAKKKQNISTQQALFSVNYAKDLEGKLEVTEKNQEKIEDLAQEVQEKIISQDKDAAVQSLRDMQLISNNQEKLLTETADVNEVINVQSEELDEELDTKTTRLKRIKENEGTINEEILALEKKKENAKKSEVELIQRQIDDSYETLEYNKKQQEKAETDLNQTKEKVALVKQEQSEIKSVLDQITSGDIKTAEHTKIQKKEIEISTKELAGENVSELLAEVEAEKQNTSKGSNVNIDQSVYKKLDERYVSTLQIEDEKEKVLSQKELNVEYVRQISKDINRLENSVATASNKEELEQEIKGLYELKKSKESKVKSQNDKLYQLAKTKVESTVSTDSYVQLDKEYQSKKTINKPKEQTVEDLRKVNDSIIEIAKKDIASLESKLDLSSDSYEKEVISKAIKDVKLIESKKQKEAIELDKLSKIKSSFSNEKFIGIDDELKAEKTSNTPVLDNKKLAKEGVEKVKSDLLIVEEAKLSSESEVVREVLRNRINELKTKEAQYQFIIDKSDAMLAKQESENSVAEENAIALKKQEEQKRLEKVEADKIAQEKKLAEEKAKEQESKLAEEKQQIEEAKLVEEKLKIEEERIAEEKRREEEKKLAQENSSVSKEKSAVSIVKEKIEQKEKVYQSISEKINNSTSETEKITHNKELTESVYSEKQELNKRLSLSEDDEEKALIKSRIGKINDLEVSAKKEIEKSEEQISIKETNQLLSEVKENKKYKTELDEIDNIESKPYDTEQERLIEKKKIQEKLIADIDSDVAKLNDKSKKVNDISIKQEVAKEISRLEKKSTELKRDNEEIAINISAPKSTKSSNQLVYQNENSNKQHVEKTDRRAQVVELKKTEKTLQQELNKDSNNKKIEKDLIKTKSERIEIENELISEYKEVNKEEINHLKSELEVVKTAIVEQGISNEQTSSLNKAEDNAKNLVEEAALLRYQTTQINDKELINIKLTKAYQNELEAIKELNDVKLAYEELANQNEIDAKQLAFGKELSENNTDVSVIAKSVEFESELAQENFNSNKGIIEEIQKIDDEIKIIESNDFLTTEENKKLDQLFAQKTSKEIELAKGLSAANEIEYVQNDNEKLALKNDVEDFNINSELKESKNETEKEEDLIKRLFKEAHDLEAKAQIQEDKEVQKELYKQANIKERIAIMKQQEVIDSYAQILKQNLIIERESVTIEENHNLSNNQKQKAEQLKSDSEILLQKVNRIEDSLAIENTPKEEIDYLVSNLTQQAKIKQELADLVSENAKELEELETTSINQNKVIENLSSDEINTIREDKIYDTHFNLSESKKAEKVELKSSLVELAKAEISQQKLINKGEQYEFEANVTSNPEMRSELLERAAENKESAQLLQGKINTLKQKVRASNQSIQEIDNKIADNKKELTESKKETIDAIYAKVEDNTPLLKQVATNSKEEQTIEVEKATQNTQETENKTSFSSVTLDKIDVKTFKVPEKINQPIFSKTDVSKSSYSDETPMPINEAQPEGLFFRVQIGAFTKPVSNDAFKGFAPISGEKIPGSKWVRYMAGYFTIFDLANDAKKEIREIPGYSDAFVVAFYNGKKISISEARRIYAEGGEGQLAKENSIELPEQINTGTENSNTTEGDVADKNSENNSDQNSESKSDSEVKAETNSETQITKVETNNAAESTSLYLNRNVESTDAGIIVSVIIDNSNTDGFAKLEETIPTGFTAEVLTKSAALYKQEENLLTFIWEELSKDEIEIRYALYPDETILTGVYKIEGKFTPEFNDVVQVDPVSYFAYENPNNTNIKTETKEVAVKEKQSISNTPIEEISLEKIKNIELDPDKAAYYNDVKNAAEAEQVETIKGLFFTVQIGVYSKAVPSSSLFNIVPLNTELIKSGLLRYTTGKYSSVDEASVRKDAIRLIGVKDAFITAYFNGERITIAKANELLAKFGAEILAK